MHRKNLLNLLEVYRENYEEEKETVEQFIQFISHNEDCFERTLEIGHITGSAWVVNNEGNKILLTHHRKLNKWLQLGGHADGESDILKVALKEVEEESGFSDLVAKDKNILDIDVHLIPKKNDVAAHYHYDVRFLIAVNDTTNYVVSDESHDLAWIPIEKLATLTTEESIVRMAKKWQKFYDNSMDKE